MQSESVDRALLYVIWAGLFLLLFMPLIVSTDTIFPFIVGKAIYSRIIIALVFGLWAILAFRNEDFRPPRSRLVILLGIYLFISLSAGIFGVSFQRSLWSTFERMQGIVDLAHWVALLIVLASVIRTKSSWVFLLNANMGISLLVALIGLGQSTGAESIPFYRYLQAEGRIGVTLGNPAFVATYLMLNAVIATGLLLRSFWSDENLQPVSQARKRRRSRRQEQEKKVDIKLIFWRSFWIIVVSMNLWVMTLTGTRGAVIGLIAGIGVFAMGYVLIGNQKVLKRSLLMLVAIVVLMGVLLIGLRDSAIVRGVASNNILVERMTDLRPEQDPFTSRLFALTVGYKSILERPIVGWGPENYIVPYGRYYVEGTSSLEVLDQAHNKPIEELVTKGTLGLISYLAIWFLIFRIAFQRAKNENQPNQIFILTVAAALASYFVQNLFLFDTPVASLQFIIFTAIIVNLETDNRESTSDTSNSSLADAGNMSGSSTYRLFAPLRSFVEALAPRPVIVSTLPVAAIVVAVFLALSSVWINLRAFNAAGTILEIGRGVSSLDNAIATVDQSISSFPALANYPRLIYIKNVGLILPDLSEGDAQRLVEFAQEVADDAMVTEPQNWRILVIISEMYRDVARHSPVYEGVDEARFYLSKAEKLAPERNEVLRLLWQVEAIEEQRAALPKQKAF